MSYKRRNQFPFSSFQDSVQLGFYPLVSPSNSHPVMLLDHAQFFILLLAACCTVIYSKPVTMHIGAGASRLQRRSLASNNGSNITEILSRFESITSAVQVGSSANSIKSLTYITNPVITGCKQDFNFTLAAVRSSEFILRAKLQLYLRRAPSSNFSYVISIRMRLESGMLSNSSLMKEMIPANDEYVEFEVTDLLRLTLATASHAVFNIQVLKFHSTLNSMKHLQCGEDLEFVSSDYDQASVPVLIIFSHDQSLHNINYATIERKVLQASGVSSSKAEGSHRRRKRSVQGCGDFSLVIPTSAITQEMIGGTSFSIASPLNYDARICGGVCHYNTPRTSIAHAQILHLHLRLNPNNHGYSISQCCLPASYEPLTITGSEPGAPIVKLILKSMSVKKCGCLDTAD